MTPPVLANGAAKLPSDGAPRPWPETCSVLRRKVARLLSQVSDDDTVLRSTQQRARASMAVIREALQRYWSKELSLSYNGGKDCLVLLILILACLPDPTEPLPAAAQGPAAESPTQGPMELLQAIYIAPPDPFPDVEDFVAVSASHYHLDLMRYSMPMRDALAAYRFDRPPVKAIFMGTRRTDPHSQSLTPFSPTDGDWPSLMRVNPVLDWHYPEIWVFIRHLDIPYCSLYDRGYTSLGGMRDTRPNPALAVDDGTGAKAFRPAYELMHDDEERLGRDQ